MFDWNPKANELFLAVKELSDPGEIERFLDERCGPDQHLRSEVEELLSANESAGEFLNEPVVPDLMAPANAKRETDSEHIEVGSTVGRYKLLEEIGEGGFGVVYMAEQRQPVQRKVALKIIKPGMDTRDVVARFEAERQAVAMMNHPNIAKVLDAGTTRDGRPYFVMELVQGLPLTEFCNEAELSIEERLSLFTVICRAVQHAHQKGVIHRDIKPSNILVTLHGDEPVPMIIDFGVAKALNQPLTAKTLFTRYGQMVGTPQYMSPEQSGISGIDVDTRADIYSLGVLLYELLTDSTPLEPERIRDAAVGEIARLVQEEEPPVPSTRLSRLGDRLPVVCKQRKTDMRSLTQFVKGDLDWIVMKAIDKDRNRRYDSATNLADDVRRLLAVEPIEARAPTARYRAVKFLRRNRIPVTLFAVFVVGLFVGLVGTTTAWLDAAKAKEQEEAQRKTAQDNEAELKRHLYASLMARAEIATGDGKLSHARDLVEDCPEEHRGWEWNHLRLRSKAREVLSVPGYGLASFSRDGEEIIGLPDRTKLDRNAIMAWDINTGDARTVIKSDSELCEFALSHDRGLLAYTDKDARLTLFDIADKSTIWTFHFPEKEEFRGGKMAFSRDGSRLAVIAFGGVWIFDPVDGPIQGTPIPVKAPQDVALSPDGNHVAVNSSVWNTTTGDLIFELHDGDYAFNCIAYSNDGKLIAKSGLTGRITLWNAENGKRLRDFVGHKSWVSSLSFSPDDTTLVSGGADTTVRLWDVDTGLQLWTVGNHDDQVYRVAFNRDGSQIASFSIRNGFLVWNAARVDILSLRHGHVSRGAYHAPKEDRIVTAGQNGIVKIWDGLTGKLIRTVFVDPAGIVRSALHPNGTWLVTASSTGDTQLFDLETGRMLRSFGRHESYHLLFDPTGNKVLSAGGDGDRNGELLVWNTGTGELLQTIPVSSDPMNQIAVSPEGRYVAAAARRPDNPRFRGQIRVWDLENGGEHLSLPPHSTYIDSLEFAYTYSDDGEPNGLQLAAGCRDSTILLWNPETGELIDTMNGRSSWIVDLAFSADAKRLWSASADCNIGVWNLVTGEEVVTIRAHELPFGLSVSPDGKTLMTSSLDGTVRLWESESVGPQIARERGAVVKAQRVVERTYRELVFSSDVLKALEAAEDITSRIQRLAIEIAKARGDDAFAFSRQCRTAVNDPDADQPTLRLALRKATCSAEVLPDSQICSTTLAMVLYRLGEYEGAASVLDSTEDVDGVRPVLPTHEEALRQAYRDIALFRLNRLTSTRQTLAAVDNALQQVPEPGHADLQAARRELVRLTAE